MALQYYGSLDLATKVLDIVLANPKIADVDGSVKTFSNGREQGFMIQFKNKAGNYWVVAFSGSRNSDQIVVYNDVEDFSDIPYRKDGFWNSRAYFGALFTSQEGDKYQEAANEVAKILLL